MKYPLGMDFLDSKAETSRGTRIQNTIHIRQLSVPETMRFKDLIRIMMITEIYVFVVVLLCLYKYLALDILIQE